MAGIKTLSIVGVGLIGGSLGMALKQSTSVAEVVGWDIDPGVLEKAQSLGAIDAFCKDLKGLCESVSIVIVATPVRHIVPTIFRISKSVNDRLVVTDVGSVKSSILCKLDKELSTGAVEFVGGHPIAGTEHSGVEAAFPGLFVNKYQFLVVVRKFPLFNTTGEALDRQKLVGFHGVPLEEARQLRSRLDELLRDFGILQSDS